MRVLSLFEFQLPQLSAIQKLMTDFYSQPSQVSCSDCNIPYIFFSIQVALIGIFNECMIMSLSNEFFISNEVSEDYCKFLLAANHEKGFSIYRRQAPFPF